MNSQLKVVFNQLPYPGYATTQRNDIPFDIANTEMTWSDFVKVLDRYEYIGDKHSADAVVPCSFKTTDYEPAKTSRGDIKYSNGVQSIRRCTANVVDYYMLFLDFDGITAEQTKEVLDNVKDYEFYFYTSAGHRADKIKFRIILPLKTHVPVQDLYARTNNLKKLFKHGDESMFARSRLFFMPTKPEHGNIKRKHNIGKLFDLYSVELDPVSTCTKVAEVTEVSDEDMKLWLKASETSNHSLRYDALSRLVWAMRNRGFDKHVACSVFHNVKAPDTSADFDDLWSKTTMTGPGYPIINQYLGEEYRKLRDIKKEQQNAAQIKNETTTLLSMLRNRRNAKEQIQF